MNLRMNVLRATVICSLAPALALPCTLLVAAAADLTSLQKSLSQAIPGCSITLSYGSSGTLARQIDHGADFDVFLSANKSFVDALVAAARVDPATVTPYARGRLGLWSSKKLKWRDLHTNAVQRVSIANPVHAPYGLAAKQALERQGLWRSLQPKIVYGENVRQAWQFAATGNVDATICAWSLMHDKSGQLLPQSWHDPILQVAAIPKRSRNPEAARRFIAWLVSDQGQRMLAAEGFEPVPRVLNSR